MKLIIAGSRTLTVSNKFLDSFITMEKLQITEIVSGGASGIDECGENFQKCYTEMGVRYYNPNTPTLTKFLADWKAHGKAAGPIRNKQMAEYADALLLIWDGESRGSASMKNEMVKLNKPVYEIIIRKTV